MIDEAWDSTADKALEWIKTQDYKPETIRDDEEVRLLYLEQWLGPK